MKNEVKTGNLTIGDGETRIALPLTGRNASEMIDEARKAAACPAEIIEFRADLLENGTSREDLTGLLRELKDILSGKCLLFTLRSANEGGALSVTEEEYERIISDAVLSGSVDLADVEAFFGTETPTAPEAVGPVSLRLLSLSKKAGIPVIFSNHDFKGTPDKTELMRRMRLMEEAGADIAKIACMPAGPHDAGRIAAVSALAAETLGIPHILIAMGPEGRLTRACANRIGSAVSFGCLPGEESAPGQMDVQHLEEALKESRNRAKYVFLTGFMGTGKTAVSREIARRGVCPVRDMDRMIAEREGRSIPEIFRDFGEEYFRDAETAVLASFLDRGGEVISTGGGIVLREENAALMRALGHVFLLEASPSVLLSRLKGTADQRPNIRGRMSEDGIKELLEKRQAFYLAAAEIRIDTGERSLAECADMVLETLENGRAKPGNILEKKAETESGSI